jgi:hypothetical protein
VLGRQTVQAKRSDVRGKQCAHVFDRRVTVAQVHKRRGEDAAATADEPASDPHRPRRTESCFAGHLQQRLQRALGKRRACITTELS